MMERIAAVVFTTTFLLLNANEGLAGSPKPWASTNEFPTCSEYGSATEVLNIGYYFLLDEIKYNGQCVKLEHPFTSVGGIPFTAESFSIYCKDGVYKFYENANCTEAAAVPDLVLSVNNRKTLCVTRGDHAIGLCCSTNEDYECPSILETFTVAPTPAPTLLYHLCRPDYTITRVQCDARIARCANEGIPMKWTGTGCVFNGVRKSDGGCQCDEYCGYACEVPCNRDSQCYWHGEDHACYHKNGTIGVPMDPCPPGYY